MKLTTEQLKATRHDKGPALILAVPGAGKTTMLLYRTLNLINSGVNPNNILSITFSKSAAVDMKKRFNNLFPNKGINIRFSTIHSFCYGIINEYSRIKGIQFEIIEGGFSKYNKSAILMNIYKSYNSFISEEKLETLFSQISYCKNMMISPEKYLEVNKSEVDNFIEIYYSYENFKRKHKLIDFDDMITFSYNILKENNYIKNKLRKRYDYIQVDEGQDTSFAQMMVIKEISKPNNNIFIVADDDQSIYGFRGANPKGLFDLKEEFPNLKIYYLQNNFRSTKNIVSTCNFFIQNNSERFHKVLKTDNSFGSSVNIVKFKENIDQYNFILDKIKSNPNQSFAILYRNNLSAVGIVEMLERNNLSFHIKDTKNKFFSHWVVRDVLNILYFAQNQQDLNIFSEIYYKIKGYTSKKHIDYLRLNNYSDSIFKNLLHYPGLSNRYKNNFLELAKDFNILKNLNISDSIEFINYTLNYDSYLKDFSKKYGYVYKNVKLYMNFLKYIGEKANSLDDFIGRLKHLEYIIKNNQDNNSNIFLSTIHSAKGLEFDTVFIIDLAEGILPSLYSIDEFEIGNISPMEEERRIFYVAMTRSKSELYILYSKYTFGEFLQKSRYIDELISIENPN